MFAQHAIACVLCELLLELFLVFFQTLKRFLTSFSILFNFQGPVRLSLAADDLFILPPKWFFVKPYFLEAFELSELGHPRSFSEQTGTFQRLLVLFKGFLLRLRKSFFCLSAWRSSIIPHARPFGNPFFQLFCPLFSLCLFLLVFCFFSSLLLTSLDTRSSSGLFLLFCPYIM